MLGAVKYFLAGLLFYAVGTLFFGSSTGFQARSEPADLRVVELQSKRDTDGRTKYRPVFTLEAPSVNIDEYAGNIWTSPPPHAVGDIVPGRFDAKTGQMRSDKMLKRSSWIGRIARYLGLFIGLQGIALLFGFPERWLPLPVRFGRKSKARLSGI